MKKEKKGNAFEGMAGGKWYVRMAKLFGFNDRYYERALGEVELEENAKILDLGCGPGALSFAIAKRHKQARQIIGIDISKTQLDYARHKAADYGQNLEFVEMSMDELQFDNNYFDLIVSSMALHETPPKIRRKTICEVARTLKSGGAFVYTDWSRPRFGLFGIIWFPLICFGKNNKDNWHNHYLRLCTDAGLERIEDEYLNSIARRQVFVKKAATS